MNGKTKAIVLSLFAKGVFANLTHRVGDETNTCIGYESAVWNLSSEDFWKQAKNDIGVGPGDFEPGERALMIQAVREAWVEETKYGYSHGTAEDAEKRFKA